MTRRGRRRSTSDTRRGASKVLRRVYPRGMLWDTPQGDTTSCTYGKIFRIRLLFPASAETSFVSPAKKISQGVPACPRGGRVRQRDGVCANRESPWPHGVRCGLIDANKVCRENKAQLLRCFTDHGVSHYFKENILSKHGGGYRFYANLPFNEGAATTRLTDLVEEGIWYW